MLEKQRIIFVLLKGKGDFFFLKKRQVIEAVNKILKS